MPKPPKNCWDFWKCPDNVRTKCPAYITNSGKECWFVAGSFAKTRECPKVKNKFKTCIECPWFIKLNPDYFEEKSGAAEAAVDVGNKPRGAKDIA